jgi:integrase
MEVNIYIIKSKKNKKGKAPLRMTVGSYIKIPLGISVTVKNWNEKKQRVTSSEDFYYKLNERIETRIRDVDEYLKSTDNPDPKEIERIAKRDLEVEPEKVEEKQVTLFEHLDSFIERQRIIKSSGYVRNLKAVRDALYKHNSRLKFTDIGKTSIESFVKFLILEGKENATIEVYIRRLKLMIKDAIETGIKVNRTYKDISYKSGKYKHVRLTWDEVEKIDSLSHISKELILVKDAFIFRCNTGLRDSDYHNISFHSFIKKGGKVHLRFNSKKTGEDQYISLNSKALEIANKYAFELPKFTQQYFNRTIKLIGKEAEIVSSIEKIRHIGKKRVITIKPKWDMISSHTARRTFARRWYDLGGDIRLISHFLNHKNEAQTRDYIGLDDDLTNAEMIRVFDQGEIFK